MLSLVGFLSEMLSLVGFLSEMLSLVGFLSEILSFAEQYPLSISSEARVVQGPASAMFVRALFSDCRALHSKRHTTEGVDEETVQEWHERARLYGEGREEDMESD